MTEADELRQMLDERGIEYEKSYIEGIVGYAHVTEWKPSDNVTAYYVDYGCADTIYFWIEHWDVPPEQAVEMMVEPKCYGSFHRSSDLSSGRVPIYHCKTMNKSIFVMRDAKYCPLCGGRIEA